MVRLWSTLLGVSLLLSCGRTGLWEPVGSAFGRDGGSGFRDGGTSIDTGGFTRVLHVAAGGAHTCAVTSQGGVKCWGRNDKGQLGNNTFVDSNVPVDVVGLQSGVVSVALGEEHSCAILSTGGLKCWGSNEANCLGNIWVTESAVPIAVEGVGPAVKAVALGDMHTCVLLSTGGVKCFGIGFTLGIGISVDTTAASWWALDVDGLTGGAAALSAGLAHTCVVMSDGTVQCWGWVEPESLLNGSPNPAVWAVPRPITGFTGAVASLASGGEHNCVILKSGEVVCWGRNILGELGSDAGVTVPSTRNGCPNELPNCRRFTATPTVAAGLFPSDAKGAPSGVQALALNNSYSCALLTSGAVKCWGDHNRSAGLDLFPPSDAGILEGEDSLGLVEFITSGATSISVGNGHMCATLADGHLQCWGQNASGQLGTGNNLTSARPVTLDF